jgi:CHAD domain-containing protein
MTTPAPDPHQSAAEGARTAALGHVDAALSVLAHEPDGREKAVHEARKSLKQARAMLRLVRPALSRRAFADDNAALRDLGRRLAPARDAWVRVETLDELTAGDVVGPGTFDRLREVLVARHRETSAAVLDDPVVVAEVRDGLAAVRDRILRWEVATEDLAGDDVAIGGLQRVYAQGRERFHRAARKPTPTRLHDWRKRVKDLGYQMRFLAPAWTPVLEAEAAECQVTWDRLGTDHDLVVLREDVEGLADVFARPADLALLDDLIDHRRTELQRGALSLGRRLYAEEPDAFVARVSGYLRAWHRDAEDVR